MGRVARPEGLEPPTPRLRNSTPKQITSWISMFCLGAHRPSIAMARRQLGRCSPPFRRVRTLSLLIPFKIIKGKGRPHCPHRPKRFDFKHLCKTPDSPRSSAVVRSRPTQSSPIAAKMPRKPLIYNSTSCLWPCGPKLFSTITRRRAWCWHTGLRYRVRRDLIPPTLHDPAMRARNSLSVARVPQVLRGTATLHQRGARQLDRRNA